MKLVVLSLVNHWKIYICVTNKNSDQNFQLTDEQQEKSDQKLLEKIFLVHFKTKKNFEKLLVECLEKKRNSCRKQKKYIFFCYHLCINVFTSVNFFLLRNFDKFNISLNQLCALLASSPQVCPLAEVRWRFLIEKFSARW